ncbi:hypothetical protein HMPREF0321_0441 [Dermacoccus sp. Ellin185]|nr:hypothetical protein HMPREF0321_0441 [Dermacoccus sp. Ellin185]
MSRGSSFRECLVIALPPSSVHEPLVRRLYPNRWDHRLT